MAPKGQEEYLISTFYPEDYPVGNKTEVGFVTRHEPSKLFPLDAVRVYGIPPRELKKDRWRWLKEIGKLLSHRRLV